VDGHIVVAYDAASAAVARAAVRTALSTTDVTPQRREDAALVVSELVGNSVRHARPRADGTILLAWRLTDGLLEVEVTDGGGGEPVLRAAAAEAPSGRGLAIIDALARQWGYRRDGDETTVWAVLRVPSARPSAGRSAHPAGQNRRRPQQRRQRFDDGGEQLVG
jgi:anti-sigma regulatory factor (Ser/Thr protein kinase)